MTKPKHQLKPVAIARQIAHLEKYELEELANYILNSHPCDFKVFQAVFGDKIHCERIEELEGEIHEIKCGEDS